MSPDILFYLFKQIYRTGIALLVKILKYKYDYPLPKDTTNDYDIKSKYWDFVGRFDLMFFNCILQPLFKMETMKAIEQFKKELESTASKIEDSNLFDVTALIKDLHYQRRAQRNEVPRIFVGYFELINLHLSKSRDLLGSDFFNSLMHRVTQKIKKIELQIIMEDSVQIHKMDLGRAVANRRRQDQRFGLFPEDGPFPELLFDHPVSTNSKLFFQQRKLYSDHSGNILFLCVLR